MKQFEIQQVIRERIIVVPRVGDISILVDIDIRNCCSQFYRPKLDNWIEEGNCILKIAYSGKDSHMLCWFYCINLYGLFFGRYANRSDMEYNIKIGRNRL